MSGIKMKYNGGYMEKKDYPHWNYPTKKDWLKNVRKRWMTFRKSTRNDNLGGVHLGCAYYPKEVYKWICRCDKMDKLMKEYYKNG